MRIKRLLFGMVLSWMVVCLTGTKLPTAAAQSKNTRPNIILIISDDQSYRLLNDMLKSTNPVSPFKAAMMDKGVTFNNAYVAAGLCCPSRATFLTGKYPTNHRVLINENGYAIFNRNGLDLHTLPVWLTPKYRTALIGKYLNEFPVLKDDAGNFIDVNLSAPPGWDDWEVWFPGLYSDSPNPDQSYPNDPDPSTPGDVTRCRSPLGHGTNYYNYFVYMQPHGETPHLDCYPYDPAVPGFNYTTTTFQRLALEFIKEAGGGDEPFFLYLSVNGPHDPYEPHPDHTEASQPTWFNGVKYSQLYDEPNGAFNEQDISDKYEFMQGFPLLTDAAINGQNHAYTQTLRTQFSIDQMVATITDYLEVTGLANNTYVFYISDHGLLYGDHRLGSDGDPAKNYPYDVGNRVPLVVRGPGVPQGVKLNHLIISTDIAPTIAELAGATYDPMEVDGSSFASLLTSSPTSIYDWRGRILLGGSAKAFAPDSFQWLVARINQYSEIGTDKVHEDISYIERPRSKETEYYNMKTDPYQLSNIYQYGKNPPPPGTTEDRYHQYLAALINCKGQVACRAAEGFLTASANGVLPLPPAQTP